MAEKKLDDRKMPILVRVCPWLLLTVFAMAAFTKNCFLFMLDRKMLSPGISGMWGGKKSYAFKGDAPDPHCGCSGRCSHYQ